VLALEWRQVDFRAGEIRLEPGTTKNKEGRTFPFNAALRVLLERQHADHERLKKEGHVVPWVFYRMVAKGRKGPKKPKAITSMIKAFKAACRKAGCPGRILHDLRRTAVRNLVRAGVPQSPMFAFARTRERSMSHRGGSLHQSRVVHLPSQGSRPSCCFSPISWCARNSLTSTDGASAG
jgi:integrase